MTNSSDSKRKQNYDKNCKLAVKYANYICQTHNTLHATAKAFDVKTNIVINRIYDTLPRYNETLYNKVKKILNQNKLEIPNRLIQGNKIRVEKHKKVLENSIISKINKGEMPVFHVRELSELLSLTIKYTKKILHRILDDEQCIVKVVKRDIYGFYLFDIKESNSEKVLCDIQYEIIDENLRERMTKNNPPKNAWNNNTDKVYGYIKNILLNNTSNGWIIIAHKDISQNAELSYCSIKKHISIIFKQENCDIIKEQRKDSKGTWYNYYKLK